MRLMKFAASIAALAVMTFTASTHAQVVLNADGGFEGTIGALDDVTPGVNNPFDGGGFATLGTDPTLAFAGSQYAQLTFEGAENGFTGFQHQIDSVVTGANYGLALYARSLDPNLGGVNGEFRIEWLDANGAFVGGQFDNNQSLDSVTDTYALFSQTSTAPVGATSLRAVFATQSFGGGEDGSNSNVGTLLVDNLSITGPAAVPEPGSIALLGLAAFGLATRRRRS